MFGRFLHGEAPMVEVLAGESAVALLVIVESVPEPGDDVWLMLAPSRVGRSPARIGDLLMGPILDAVNARVSASSAEWPARMVAEMKETGAVLVVKDDPRPGAFRVLAMAKGSSDRLADAGRSADVSVLRHLLSTMEGL